ncbi:MAG: phosphate transport system permease protein [Chloroflexota bacterium]|jgi:phosphate transport system permease protein|nr:phosphate transport system permease protein [Chloroflexota bacterium]
MAAAVVARATISDRLTGVSAGRRRTTVDRTMRTLSLVAALLCVVPLGAVLVFVAAKGLPALSLDLITKGPKALGIGGGAANAVLGTLQMVPIAALIAIPSGVLGAIYVAEFGNRRSARIVRFCADVLVGIPSILIGIFVFTFLVLPFKQFNAFAGSVALAIIMLPVVMRTTEESLHLVPNSLREASLALGVPMWRTVLSVVLRTGLPGILTGSMLAFARAMGETAPLLFTALGSRLINVGNLGQPMDALPLFIYTNARQPIEALNEQAWGAAALLLLVVLFINIVVRARSFGRRIG